MNVLQGCMILKIFNKLLTGWLKVAIYPFQIVIFNCMNYLEKCFLMFYHKIKMCAWFFLEKICPQLSSQGFILGKIQFGNTFLVLMRKYCYLVGALDFITISSIIPVGLIDSQKFEEPH